MLQTDQVAQSLHCQTGEEKIPEFPGAIQCSGIVDDMVVDVFPVGMSGNDKSVFTFQEAGGQLITNAVCILCCDFAGSEGLPYLIGYHIAFLAAPGSLLVQFFREHELLIHGKRAALIAADKLALFGLVWILCIVGAVFQAGGNRFPFVLMQCNQTSSSQSRSPPLNEKSRPKAAKIKYFLQFSKPFTEPSDALCDGSCTEKENEADKFRCQQNQKLIPSLAVGGIDAAAESINGATT